jgi:hypothetical protein
MARGMYALASYVFVISVHSLKYVLPARETWWNQHRAAKVFQQGGPVDPLQSVYYGQKAPFFLAGGCFQRCDPHTVSECAIHTWRGESRW